jgi:16S rRNA (cytosine967-C5)-methyltransferase
MNALARQAAVYPDLSLDPLDARGLDERDAAFAHAIYDAVIRRWITLGFLIEQYTPRPFRENEPQTQAALLAGAAQVLLLDRVPAHAAINASVEWAKHAARASVGGFVNAVLRKVASLAAAPSTEPSSLPERAFRPEWTNRADEIPLGDGRALVLRAAVLPADPITRLAIATSHPTSLVRHWCEMLGIERTERLALHDQAVPPTTLCTAYAANLPANLPASSCEPHELKASSVFTGGRDELAALLASRPDVWVQDAASSLAVEHLRVMRGGADWVGEGLIVDVCAGQGTKTRQLAAAFPKARIVAADPAPERAKALAEVAARIGDRVKVLPLPEVYRTCRGKAALVLLDVPCTNSGVLARRVEARYRFDREQTARLVETQREIMHSGVGLLSTEGVLCYSTCSIDDAENADQADWLASQGALTLVRSEQTLPAGLPGEPGRLYHDGAFAAVFVRKS